MEKRFIYFITFILFVFQVSCEPYSLVTSPPSPEYPPSANLSRSGPRMLILEGDTITSEEFGGFTCWYCSDFTNGGKTLVEVGFYDELNTLGFILFDGTYSGEVAIYQREGLDHTWYWGDDANYKFRVKTDGTGLYYDFSSVPDGESTKPSEIFKCKKR